MNDYFIRIGLWRLGYNTYNIIMLYSVLKVDLKGRPAELNISGLPNSEKLELALKTRKYTRHFSKAPQIQSDQFMKHHFPRSFPRWNNPGAPTHPCQRLGVVFSSAWPIHSTGHGSKLGYEYQFGTGSFLWILNIQYIQIIQYKPIQCRADHFDPNQDIWKKNDRHLQCTLGTKWCTVRSWSKPEDSVDANSGHDVHWIMLWTAWPIMANPILGHSVCAPQLLHCSLALSPTDSAPRVSQEALI